MPTSSTSTRLIINSGTDGQVNLPWRRRLMRALQPRCALAQAPCTRADMKKHDVMVSGANGYVLNVSVCCVVRCMVVMNGCCVAMRAMQDTEAGCMPQHAMGMVIYAHCITYVQNR